MKPQSDAGSADHCQKYEKQDAADTNRDSGYKSFGAWRNFGRHSQPPGYEMHGAAFPRQDDEG
jgi:hypothetical protein